jgi:hypothetical protein
MSKKKEFEIELDGIDLLLSGAIGILFIVLLCMVWPEWNWEWHSPRWYWVRLVWYWEEYWWVQWLFYGFACFVLAVLFYLRSRYLQ